MALAPNAVEPAVLRYIITGLGFVAATVLPSIALTIGTLVSDGRSVMGVQDLAAEVRLTVENLFFITGLVFLALSGILLIAFSGGALFGGSGLGNGGLPSTQDAIQAGSGIVGGALLMLVLKISRVPKAIFRVLELKAELAEGEARRQLNENVAQISSKKIFPVKPGFGETVPHKTG